MNVLSPAILLLEDEEDLLQVLSTALAHARPDLHVEATTSLDEAESALRRLTQEGRALALAIVDYRIPDGNGLDLLYRVRERHPDVPTLMLTGQAPTEAEDDARRVGARVLWKPMDLSSLLGEVELLLAS